MVFIYPAISHMFYLRACAQSDRDAILCELTETERAIVQSGSDGPPKASRLIGGTGTVWFVILATR